MVVMAASVINKTGKALVSRQFVDMSQIRIEGMLAAFPKLVGVGKQHTYVETDRVRYVYQPMESLYLLLVTNKQSNILEDLETLRLLSKLVQEYSPALDEEGICKVAFELIFAFDEVISLGHKESVTVAQVKQYLEMESHEEKLHQLIVQSKINDTKDVMKRKASEIDKNKIEKLKSDKGRVIPTPIRLGNGFNDIASALSEEFGSNSGFGASLDLDAFSKSKVKARASAPAPSKGSGMQLGKSQKTAQFIESLKSEGEIIVEDVQQVVAGPSKSAVLVTDPIAVSIEERLVVLLKKDGGLENFELQGTLSLLVQKKEDAYVRIQIETGANKGFQFITHPMIDKELFSRENILGLKDPNRPFPSGTPSGILKWRMQSRQEYLVPLNINCWPSISGGDTFVNIEYESSKMFELQNVLISIPLPALREPPIVNQVDGDWRYDSKKCVLEWSIVLIDNTNRSGSMEFLVPSTDSSTFFPIDVKFNTVKTFCDIKVANLSQTQGGSVLKFSGRTQLVVQSYQIA